MHIHKIEAVSHTYRQILSVLFKYGFGYIIDALHIGHNCERNCVCVNRDVQATNL